MHWINSLRIYFRTSPDKYNTISLTLSDVICIIDLFEHGV